MISQTVEYALRAMVCLAMESDNSMTVEQIAERTRVPPSYLSKVLQSLRKKNLLISQRGLGGGFTLRKSAAEITILEVVNAVDPIPRIHTCPLDIKEHGVNLCPLHQRLDNALAMVEQAFLDSTIAELLTEPTASPPLCALESLGQNVPPK
jgi:Rrf2 family protein